MSTFLIIKPDFEKNHESEKGLDTIRQHQTDFMFLQNTTCPRLVNSGQIFEAVLGRAGKELGVKFATPIFDGVSPLWLDGNAGVFNAKRPCVRIETQGRCMENFFTL